MTHRDSLWLEWTQPKNALYCKAKRLLKRYANCQHSRWWVLNGVVWRAVNSRRRMCSGSDNDAMSCGSEGQHWEFALALTKNSSCASCLPTKGPRLIVTETTTVLIRLNGQNIDDELQQCIRTNPRVVMRCWFYGSTHLCHHFCVVRNLFRMLLVDRGCALAIGHCVTMLWPRIHLP